MDVGPDGVLLTTFLYSFTQSMVPYSGDEHFYFPDQTGRTRPRFDAGFADWLEF